MSMNLSESEQEAVLGHALTDYNFFLKSKKNLKKTWFTHNPTVGVVFDQLCKIYDRDKIYIKSVMEFKQDFFFQSLTLQDQKKYYDLIDRCIHSSKEFGIDRLKKKLTGFMRVSLFKESIEGGAKRFGIDGMESAYEWTKKKITDLQDATFEDNQFVMKFNDAATWVAETKKFRDSAFSTGSKELDRALGGGLFRGETLAIMAPSNTGKTTWMISLVRHLVMQKLNVAFFVHEGSPRQIREKILCSFLCVSRARLYEMTENPKTRDIVNSVADYINQYLTYIPYIKTGGMYIEDVTTMIKDLNDDLINRTGKGFDVIVDDYPKKLKSRAAMGSKESLARIMYADTYDVFNHIATTLDCNCVVAVQTNRAGLKQNNGKTESDTLLGMEEIDEAFGIAQNMGNIVTLNRTPEDKKLDIIRMNIAKSRNDATDIVICSRSSYKCSVIFGDKEMIDNGGAWDTEIEHNMLPTYFQDSNKMIPSAVVDQALKTSLSTILGSSTESDIPVGSYHGKAKADA
jgi:hypothetical protein